jgi:hypothetical protein
MKEEKKVGGGCACCQNPRDVLMGNAKPGPQETGGIEAGGLSRVDFLKVVALGAVGLSTIMGTKAFAATKESPSTKIVRGGKDIMVVDQNNRELRISATVTKDASKPAVVDWGRRFQAFFGTKGGKMEPYFVFTTEVSRAEVNKALQGLGVTSRRQIPMNEVAKRTGLKSTTTKADYLAGDPIIVTVRFEKGGKIVEAALEDLIEEKIMVDGAEVIKPYTPHFIYHGTAEAINFPSGCIVCPSDCNGGIITDNVLPLKTTVNYYKVNWNRMPAVGSKAEVVLKSIYGPNPYSSVKG